MRLPSTPAEDRLPVREIALLWLATASIFAIGYWTRLDESLGFTDNVMRMAQVRGLLDGMPWFDPHEPRLAPPAGYDTHWSRLIDAGVAGLILMFRQVVAPDLAERLARCIWPLLVSGPAVFAAIAIAARLGGNGAGRATLLVALPTVALLPMFRPGEIDHHNAQIMLALVTFACVLWCERRYLATAAGLAGGVLLAVGLEAAHVPTLIAAGLALLVVHDTAWRRPARDFGLALAVSVLVGFLAVTPARYRFVPQCDALAVNSAAAVIVGAVGLAIGAGLSNRFTARMRFLVLAAAAVLALATFAWLEPRCLKGPFGSVDPAVFPVWLDRVKEMQSLGAIFRTNPSMALTYAAFPVIAALSVLAAVRAGLRTPLGWTLVAAFVLSWLIMLNQIRYVMYVLWLGLPFVGIAAQWLAQKTSRPILVRTFAAVLASPPVVTLAINAQTATAADQASVEEDGLPCFLPSNYRALAGLPKGLVLSSLDLGPSVLANTPHTVVAAPYHRADRAILFNQQVMDGPSAAARPALLARGVDYLVSCSALRDQLVAGSFQHALLAGNGGAWLEPIAASADNPLKIWRVR